MLQLHFISDPGHGWLQVDRDTAWAVMGHDFVRLSSCSYQRGELLFLEEDCDAPLFLNCAKAKGLEVVVHERSQSTDSVVRSFDSLVHYIYS
jgi:hypothetical protein